MASMFREQARKINRTFFFFLSKTKIFVAISRGWERQTGPSKEPAPPSSDDEPALRFVDCFVIIFIFSCGWQ